MGEADISSRAMGVRPRLLNARRDAIVLTLLIIGVMLLIWNGSSLFGQLRIAGRIDRGVQLMSTALTLNVALILFGWRRYVDLQHEAERGVEQARRAALLATTDAVTGLFNRKGFADRVDDLCELEREGPRLLVILSCRINRMRSVTDQHGYEVGDKLLRALAEAFSEQIDGALAIGRLGSDEFAIATLLDPDRVHEAMTMGEQAVAAAARPFAIDDRTLQVGAFVGIASAGAGVSSIAEVIRRADIAMDHARSSRIARPVWFDSGMERALIAQAEIEQGIRVGLENGQFVPYFEPQVDFATGAIVGFEVLARWKHPLSGLVSPDVFIPVAEEIGLIGRLSEQLVGDALRIASSWDPAIRIAVNISPMQFADGWLAQRIVRLLAETGFPAERLVIEVTESSLFADIDQARTIVTSLKNQGVRLALDDFGTGFSSLAHLRSLPFDIIKIDRSFVSATPARRDNLAILRAVTTLAGAIGVPVCVEGIENETAFDAVNRLGCDIGQGWYFGKPMTGDDAQAMIVAQQRQHLPPGATAIAG